MPEAYHRGLTAMSLEELWPDKRGSARAGKRHATERDTDADNLGNKSSRQGEGPVDDLQGDHDRDLSKRTPSQAALDDDDGSQRPSKVLRQECDQDLTFVNEDEDPWGDGPNFDL